MSVAELALHRGIESQVNFQAWVDNLKTLSKEQIIEEITHTFAEFALKAEIVDWRFNLATDKEYFLKMVRRGIRYGSRRSWIEIEQGFIPLLEKMSESESPSFGLWACPPGSKNEGFDERYGFLYAYDISDLGNVHAFALRIEPFDNKAIFQLLQLLSAIDLIEDKRQTSKETLLVNPKVFSKGKLILLPGSNTEYSVESIEDFFFLIIQFLPDNFTEKDIQKGLVGGFLKDIKRKFASTIHKIYTKVWQAANDYSFEFQVREFSDLLRLNFPGVMGGSCPAVMDSSLSSSETVDQSNAREGMNYCPICGASFYGTKCPVSGCNYTVNQGESTI